MTTRSMTNNKIFKSSSTTSKILIVVVALANAATFIKCLRDETDATAGQRSPSGQLWLVDWADIDHHQRSPKLAELLNRTGPNMRASADYHDFNDVHLNESIESWRILHEQTKQFAQQQVQFYKPRLSKLIKDAKVSPECSQSVEYLLTSMENLASWAVQMWSATGNFPPTGLFDGQFTDLGSYVGCIDVDVPDDKKPGGPATPASYCVVPFRPIVPTRRAFHQIFQKEQAELVNLFDPTDALRGVLDFSQYFHYVYLKSGLCVPSQCSPVDIQLVAKVIGQRLALMTGPVKCFTRAMSQSEWAQARRQEDEEKQIVFGEIEDKPVLIELSRSMNTKQVISFIVVAGFFGVVFLSTIWHMIELTFVGMKSWRDEETTDDYVDGYEKPPTVVENNNEMNGQHGNIVHLQNYNPLKHLAFNYFSMITNGNEFLDVSMRSNEIKCLHGLRVITMVWIICVHTLQYNEWSGWTRIFENEGNLQNPYLHPLFNANYVVDNFFLMSGLLAAYTTWYSNKGTSSQFSIFTSLVQRYLRLTPQVLLISLLYIILPLAGHGPFWYDMTHDASKFCEKNWWINLFHIQSFYKEDEMCNLVGWWISVDMFYYILALLLLYLILNKQIQRALWSTLGLVGFCIGLSAYRHYMGGYTPNNLGTVPQIGEVWTRFVVNYVWSPYPHAYVFFLGLWVGYVLANNMWRVHVHRWHRWGWFLSASSLLLINLSSHVWMSGKLELGHQSISTTYNIICTIIWANAFSWIIVACHYGCAPGLNRLLSLKLTVILSKASFIIYLSHMLLVRAIYGSQYTLYEVSVMTATSLMIVNTILSTLFGVFLCVAFEGPCMKFQKFVINSIRSPQQRRLPIAGASYAKDSPTNNGDKVSLSLGPTGVTLMK